MAIQFISVGAYGSQSSGSMINSQVVPAPAGPFQFNDFILVIIELYNIATKISPPDGSWTQLGPTTINKAGQTLFYKRSSGVEPGSYTFTSLANTFLAGAAIQYRGASFESISVATGAATSLSSAAVTPTHNNDILMVTFTSNASSVLPVITLDPNLISRANYSTPLEGFAMAIGEIVAPNAGILSAQYTSSASGTLANLATATSLLLTDLPPAITVVNNYIDYGY